MIDLVVYEEPSPTCSGTYHLGDVGHCRLFERDGDLLLVDVDELNVEWVLLERAGTPIKYTNGVPLELAPTYSVVMRGKGYAGNLREARHTYFGPNDEELGYLFYVKPRLLSWAFDCLREWFDFRDGDAS